jgi:signal transduction histidine kinase
VSEPNDRKVSRVEPLLGSLVGASLAHELNNPLSYVMASLEYALDHELLATAEASDLRRAMHDALGGVEQIRALLSDLRKLARGEPPAISPTAIRPLLDLAVQQTIVATRGAGPVINCLRIDDLFVRANRPLLLQGVTNVLINAVQAAAETGGNVSLECERVGLRAFIRVNDEGPGVPDNFRQHLFSPLFTTKREGAGLGLYIARHGTRAMGGELELAPSMLGASFVFELAVA